MTTERVEIELDDVDDGELDASPEWTPEEEANIRKELERRAALRRMAREHDLERLYFELKRRIAWQRLDLESMIRYDGAEEPYHFEEMVAYKAGRIRRLDALLQVVQKRCVRAGLLGHLQIAEPVAA